MPLSSQFSMADEDNINEEITGAPHQTSSSTIPAGLITRAELRLHPHTNGYENGQIGHTSAKGLVYLHGLFTIIQGLYVGHTVEQIIALDVVITANAPTAAQASAMANWTVVGEHLVGRLLESAGCEREVERYRQYLDRISTDNVHNPTLQNAEFNYQQLDGLICGLELGHGYYAPFLDDGQPQISRILRPTDAHYHRVMQQHRDHYASMTSDHVSTPRPRYPQSQWSFIL